MSARDFAYWLQGFFEITDAAKASSEGTVCILSMALNHSQVHTIRQHLAMVFKHEIDPSMGDEKKQAELNALHEATKHMHDSNTIVRC